MQEKCQLIVDLDQGAMNSAASGAQNTADTQTVTSLLHLIYTWY